MAGNSSDETLISKIRERDQNAFGLLYDKYSSAIYGVISKILGDEEIAEDILQDAFLKVWTNIHDYDSQKGSIFTWMLNIARNKAIDKLRSKSHKNEIRNTVSDVNFPSTGNSTQLPVDSIGIKELLDRLKPENKEIMILSYFKGYTQEEIAELMNLPLGTVKTKMRNTLQELKKLVN